MLRLGKLPRHYSGETLMKKGTKKLVLAKETVRRLQELASAKGGTGTVFFCNPTALGCGNPTVLGCTTSEPPYVCAIEDGG